MRTINPNGMHALQKLSDDARDFSLAGIFSQIDISKVPLEPFQTREAYIVKDQGDTDFCSAYDVTSVSEDQEGVELLPEYQFFKTKLLMGNFEEWGADLRTACKVPVKFGSLQREGFEKYRGLSRAEVVSPSTWPADLDAEARKHAKAAFFKVDGRYDAFDNIRAAIWQHMDERRSIAVGALWRESWTSAPGGIIPEAYEENGSGHAFKFCGQAIFDGVPYLKAQLSNGTKIGDKGFFYFSRAVVNKEIAPFGAFMFKDMALEQVQFLQSAGLTANDLPPAPSLPRFLAFFKDLVNSINFI